MKYDINKDIKYLEDNGIVFDEWIDIDDEFYHSSPGISASGLKLIDKECPKVFKYRKEHQKEKTEALILGNAIHKYILENDDFDSEYLISPSSKKTERAHKVFINEHKEEIENGKIVLRKSDGEMLEGILASLKDGSTKGGTNTYDGIIINPNTMREKALYTIDRKRNIIKKVKVDVNIAGKFLDLKSTKSADPDNFIKDAANLGYGIQAAYYMDIAQTAKKDAKMFGFIAVEKTEPYIHSIILLDDEDVKLELSKVGRLLDEYAYCLNNDIWYGPNGINKENNKEPLFVVKKMPSWHRFKLEEENGFEGQ